MHPCIHPSTPAYLGPGHGGSMSLCPATSSSYSSGMVFTGQKWYVIFPACLSLLPVGPAHNNSTKSSPGSILIQYPSYLYWLLSMQGNCDSAARSYWISYYHHYHVIDQYWLIAGTSVMARMLPNMFWYKNYFEIINVEKGALVV